MNNLSLPVEIIREIAHKLYFDELLHFQNSSVVLDELTSDVSFYARYFPERNSTRSIELVHFYRELIPNWKDVVKWLYDDIDESTHFFYRNAHKEYRDPTWYVPPTTGCGYERLGFEMADVCFGIFIDLCELPFYNKLEEVQDIITETTKDRPELIRSERWHYFVDILYSDFENYLQHDDYRIKNLDDVEFWLETLDFAHSKGYSCFHQSILKYIIFGIMRNIAAGLITFDKSEEYLRTAISQIQRFDRIGQEFCFFEDVTPRSFPALEKAYQLLLKEIIGKRRSNCEKFFGHFVETHIISLADFVIRQESPDDLLNIFKDCLKWRFILSGFDMRRIRNVELQKICIVDETVRDIFYPNSFFPDGDCLKDITERLSHGCSINFRKACERILFSNQNVSETNELLIAGRGAFIKRAEKKLGQST
ncbi:hypothetical protein MP638_005206 [Amoeboaphelidium occidentale]|nr:hypothetical protein MP638_005206 [Amoeboaphelidium occidentale]